MLFSNDRKFIFIHIQKTAGISISKALRDVTPDAIKRFEDLEASHDRQKNRHLFASDLKNYLGDEVWPMYFKFAFVRNPWSRLVSWYNMCIERPTNPFMWYVKNNAPTFESFLDLSRGPAAKTAFNQVEYISDEAGNILVDFVGRFESLNSDFRHVCERLKIDVQLPHMNKGPAIDFRTYYNARTRALVADRFRRDIESFGYRFD